MTRLVPTALGIAAFFLGSVALVGACGSSGAQPAATPAAPAAPAPVAEAAPAPVPECEPAASSGRAIPEGPTFTVIVDAKIKPEYADKAVPFFIGHTERTTAELPGVLRHTFIADPKDPLHFVFVTTYADFKVWEAYLNSKVKEVDFPKFGEMYASPPKLTMGPSPYTF